MNVLEQTEQKLKEQIHHAVIHAELATEDQVPDIILEKPKDKAHGDFATNIAMQLARVAKKAPRQIADDIASKLNKSEASVEKVEIAGPGFINFFMKQDFLGEVIDTVLSAGDNYGKSTGGNGEKVQVEFVSVNPTGDLHLGHARNAAFGDVLCNVFAAAGYEVEREYYINDAGNQINNLGLSVEARYLQEIGQDVDMPEDGYQGQAIIEIAKELVKKDGEKWADKDHEERLDFFKEYGLKASLRNIESDLKDFRVEFDHWFSERSLFKDGQIDDTLAVLDDGGYTFEKDGALWFKTTEFGDDKDRVLIKGDGNYTYLTPDIAYHKNKLDRGFDRIINVWGSDHHGYIPRMRAALQALGYPVEKFDVKIIQMVNLFEAGEKVKMSKRTGKAVSLRELMDEVGIDAVRYYFVARSNDSQLDFDMDLAKSQSNDNPVYYAQYAHARICTMLSQAKSKGFNTEAEFDASLLTAEKELDLLKKIGELPQMIVDAADKHTPHKVTQYIFELATLLHSFYNAEKVLDADNEARTHARIALMKAVRQTLANAMTIIGISAPEKM
ncbi:arginine-tRNA ligase [Oceanobacillus iheyensis HTE831]|uniref:Arginine--tRNA ligase n=1 Tax=Oceanobacillus iheyensis (strain DSM 14371 / CIP 107618 / JCM 11309 / KCTC 3954 / HTE831) TaxID=221109 RepID=SYR_OCEIH|nr:arginine--tRNA ligase [Oceanobacillus iheyensis]Q8EM45.1 RecName: Full=Arginine--tRNA ligase; AltName: Full=Arginyl-tRNA synthetase; Short=ArgRS [Oceanobacillus iheyensis HTE831]BAC14971.1 arginine-tRNA ligase [Oceanobacillus iheyensis HTE831]